MNNKKNLKFSKMLFNGSFIYNPVLTQAIGICTIVAIGTSLKISLIFSAIVSVLLIVMQLLSSLLLKRLSRWLRVSVYMIISTLMILPLEIYMENNLSDLLAEMGIFLPLLAVNSIIVIRCEAFAVNNSVKHSFFDAVASSVGFTVVSVIVGAVRELLTEGTLLGKEISPLPRLSGLALPFGGLIILGFLSAFHKWILLKKFPRYPSSTFNLRSASDTPSIKNEGINVTDGSFSFMRDPRSAYEKEDEVQENADNEKAILNIDADDDDDIEDDYDRFLREESSLFSSHSDVKNVSPSDDDITENENENEKEGAEE